MKKSWVLATTLALFLAAAGPAYGKDPAPNPDSATTAGSLQAEAPQIGAVTGKTNGISRALAYSSCREGTWRVNWYNVFGWRIWSYVRWVRWCGSTLTSVSTRAWGEVFFPGWAFRGTISSWSSGGAGRSSYRVWSQGHFCFAEYFSCVSNMYPLIDMRVTPTGGVSGDTGG